MCERGITLDVWFIIKNDVLFIAADTNCESYQNYNYVSNATVTVIARASMTTQWGIQGRGKMGVVVNPIFLNDQCICIMVGTQPSPFLSCVGNNPSSLKLTGYATSTSQQCVK